MPGRTLKAKRVLDEKTLLALKAWFERYVGTFESKNPEHQRNIDLKKDHTRRVCMEILNIGKSLGLSEGSLYLSEVIALFHDVGRFEQYARYGTFVDLKSEDHGALGVKVLRENLVLNCLDRSTRDTVLRAIAYHNRVSLPDDETEECLFFTRLLRDADKLDIWRVVTDYYRNGERIGIIELGLPDSPEISDDVCADLMAQKMVMVGHLTTLNDFKLLQMAWVYDVNFPITFHLIRERGYLEMIRDALPKSEKISKIYSMVQDYLNNQCDSEFKGDRVHKMLLP